ncbi:hypothetical protein DL89DRAFT_265927 [Linderina pennispora]|uniref:Uncharacterized protein n=1 Tax=Linderina pennispora TaxID=61395 RepID=A0A1Y1WFL3_9FUNG|nr:uncharacterized protein DL89DRAFT_265927 [Linderina pennispora]ORX72340.1 hypothetical protein DL89DRAFT_265927 [Linderina pennispora]
MFPTRHGFLAPSPYESQFVVSLAVWRELDGDGPVCPEPLDHVWEIRRHTEPAIKAKEKAGEAEEEAEKEHAENQNLELNAGQLRNPAICFFRQLSATHVLARLRSRCTELLNRGVLSSGESLALFMR